MPSFKIDLKSVKDARVVGNIRSRVTGVLMVDSTGKLYDYTAR